MDKVNTVQAGEPETQSFFKRFIGRDDAYVFSFGLYVPYTRRYICGLAFDYGVGSTYGTAKVQVQWVSPAKTPRGRFCAISSRSFALPFQSYFRNIGHERFMRLFPKG